MASREPRRGGLGLRARFLVSAIVVAATTALVGAWSAATFFQLSHAVDVSLRDTVDTTSALASLTTALEREDDALLLSLSLEPQAAAALARTRERVDSASLRLVPLLRDPGEPALAALVRSELAAYRGAADGLIAAASTRDAFPRYHREVNPLLRQIVSTAARLREQHFVATQSAAERARDDARRATVVVSAIALAALALSALVAYYLNRVVVLPLRTLTRTVDALREGDFERRVEVQSTDELGRLAEGFNLMAEGLEEFRRSNLAEVLRAKQTLEATLEALPDAVFVVEPDGRLAQANTVAEELLPRAAKEARVEALALSPAAQRALSAALAGNPQEPAATELREALSLSVRGRPRRLLPRAMPVRALPEQQRGAVLVLYDVTELARLDEMRVELVAVASHELRTPLTTLRMTLLLLQETAAELRPRQRELLATALVGVEQLALTVDEFLDLTRIESGQLRLRWAPLSVPELFAHACRAESPACEEAGIALRHRVEAGAERAWGDDARLGVVLSNLLRNAVKYTPAGGSIELHGVPSAEREGWLELTVTDTGRGVPEELRERVFEKFFRVEHYQVGGDTGVRGAGIGLYLCRQIVEAHGGVVTLEAGPDARGTRVRILLPARPAEPAA